MGKPGPKPKPIRLRMLCGNPSRRPLPKNEPRPESGAPPMPDWLDELAKQEWLRIVPGLEACGILSCVDSFVLEGYCVCYSHWRQAEEVVSRAGMVYKSESKKGERFLHQTPHVMLSQKYLAQARLLATELGLSPSSRARLGCPQVSDPNDPLEEFFRRNGK